MIGWHLKIENNWYPVEVMEITKKAIKVRVPVWERLYNDFRLWSVKRKELKFYAN